MHDKLADYVVERWKGDRGFEKWLWWELVPATSPQEAIELSIFYCEMPPDLRDEFTTRNGNHLRAEYRHKDENPNWSDIIEARLLDK